MKSQTYLNQIISIVNLIYGNQKKYIINLYKNEQTKVATINILDHFNNEIYFDNIYYYQDEFLSIANSIRKIIASYDITYSRLLQKEGKIYQQNLYVQNLQIHISVDSSSKEEIINAAKSHKNINLYYQGNNNKTAKIKTIQQKISVG